MAKQVFLISNGIDASSGKPLASELDVDEVARFLLRERRSKNEENAVNWFKRLLETVSQRKRDFPPDLDPTNVRKAGWGILYAPDLDPAVKDALQRLVQYRREQAADPRLVKEFTYQGEKWAYQWLNDHGIALGMYDPYRVPYYLLIAGSPKTIPFSFGFELGAGYSVGRLDFETPDQYARYIDSLIAYEKAEEVFTKRQVVYFAPAHDLATEISRDQLVNPLVWGVPESEIAPALRPVADEAGFTCQAFLGYEATKDRLRMLFSPPPGEKAPALLFTAGHGLGVSYSDPRQVEINGGLYCPLPDQSGWITPDNIFAGSDLPAHARLSGMITFHFACFGGGTPDGDRFAKMFPKQTPYFGKDPFLAALPRNLLSHPAGGGLACIAHVDRSYVLSIDSRRGSPRYQPYRNTLYRLMQGEPVGHALSREFSLLSTRLARAYSDMKEEVEIGARIRAEDLSAFWVERNDTGSFLVIGDPAARLKI